MEVGYVECQLHDALTWVAPLMQGESVWLYNILVSGR